MWSLPRALVLVGDVSHLQTTITSRFATAFVAFFLHRCFSSPEMRFLLSFSRVFIKREENVKTTLKTNFKNSNTSQRPFVSRRRRRRRREEAQSSGSIHIRIMTGGGSYDEVDLEDMDWNESLKEFTYSCPCGDIFRITLEELKDGEEIARCPSCSLVLTVIYDPDELPSITNVEAATSGTTEEIA